MTVRCFDCSLPVRIMKAAKVALKEGKVVHVCMRCWKKNWEAWLDGTKSGPSSSNNSSQ